ncbi:MAG: hypothetical protein Kow0090_08380 [Myxococcota bacterium]
MVEYGLLCTMPFDEKDISSGFYAVFSASKRERVIVIVILSLAVLYRILIIFFDRFDTDEASHMSVAWTSLSGREIYCGAFWIFPPLYWGALKPFIALFGEGSAAVIAARLFSVSLSIIIMWRLAVLGRRLYGDTAMWAMPLLYTLTINSARTGGEIRPDTLLLLLIIIAMECLVGMRLSSPRWRFLLAGWIMGLASLAKQSAFMFGFFLALFFLWRTRSEWGINLRTLYRALSAAFFTLGGVALVWVVGAFALTNCPIYFFYQTILALPQLHGEGEFDFTPLWMGFALNPTLILTIIASLGAMALYIVKKRGIPDGLKLALVFAVATVYQIIKARPLSEHYFLIVALAVALLGGAALSSLKELKPRIMKKSAYIAVGLLALNALFFEPYLTTYTPSGKFFDPRPPEEFFDKQLATMDFILKHTPQKTPVLGSNPLWVFRPGGYFNPPGIVEVLYYEHDFPWKITPERLDTIITDFISQPAIFVMLDGYMWAIMDKHPRIRRHIEENYEILYYEPGGAWLGVSRSLGGKVPKENLKPAGANR